MLNYTQQRLWTPVVTGWAEAFLTRAGRFHPRRLQGFAELSPWRCPHPLRTKAAMQGRNVGGGESHEDKGALGTERKKEGDFLNRGRGLSESF